MLSAATILEAEILTLPPRHLVPQPLLPLLAAPLGLTCLSRPLFLQPIF